MNRPNLNEIHIWLASLTKPAINPDAACQVLSHQERKKATCFVRSLDSEKYITRQHALRTLLSYYTGKQAGEIQISHTDFGKPELSHTAGQSALFFNVSYSDALCVMAFGRAGKLGVDVELIRSFPDMDAMTDLCLTRLEKKAYFALHGFRRKTSFFKYWTRKEALVKGIGTGLSYPVNQIHTALTATQRIELGSNRDIPEGPSSWFLYELHLPDTFEGTLASETPLDSIRYFQWNPTLFNN